MHQHYKDKLLGKWEWLFRIVLNTRYSTYVTLQVFKKLKILTNKTKFKTKIKRVLQQCVCYYNWQCIIYILHFSRYLHTAVRPDKLVISTQWFQQITVLWYIL